jgi:hypothetical protein
MMTSSLIAAFDNKLWTSSPSVSHHNPETNFHSNSAAVALSPSSHFVFVKFDDSFHPSVSLSACSTAATYVSAARFQELLSQAAQAFLEHSNTDLSIFASSMKSNHGNLSRSIFSIMADIKYSSLVAPADASLIAGSNSNKCGEPCHLCVLNGDSNSVAFVNSCGHGLCGSCWKDFVAAAIASSSTPMVKSGEDLSGAVTVFSMKCCADPDNQCRAKIDFAVLCQAVPQLVRPFILSTMSNVSRMLLSGGAGACECRCGAVVSGVRHLIYSFSQFLFYLLLAQILLDSEVQCRCGHVQCISDMKRSVDLKGWTPHPHLSNDDLTDWKMLNTPGSEQRCNLMRFKNCPKCGTATTKCGCPSGQVVCNGLDMCPNEGTAFTQTQHCQLIWALLFCSSLRPHAVFEVQHSLVTRLSNDFPTFALTLKLAGAGCAGALAAQNRVAVDLKPQLIPNNCSRL